MIYLHLLPGFWCSPTIFDGMTSDLKVDSKSYSLFERGPFQVRESFSQWADEFQSRLSLSDQHWILGYSLGGRLALHLMHYYPERFRGAILISTNPVSPLKKEIHDRALFEKTWHDRFLTDSWESLFQDWNRLPVFNGTAQMKGPEEMDRELLSRAFTDWSLTKHEFGWNDLERFTDRLYWAVGENDEKYVRIMNDLGIEAKMFPHAGHRLMLDRPKELAAWVNGIVTEE